MFYSSYFVVALFCFFFNEGTYGKNIAPISTKVATQCPAHSTYKTCVSPCQPSCRFPQGPSGCETDGTCMEGFECSNTCIAGCQCDDGYSVDSSKSTFECVKAGECSCYNELYDVYISPLEGFWLADGCGIMYACWNGKLTSLPYDCLPEEQCITMGTKKSEKCQSPKCPDGWTYFNHTGSCYKVIYNVTFDQAEEKCQSSGSHLTSIHDEYENVLISKITNGASGDLDYSANTYIGLYHGQWLDGSTYNFTKEIDAFFPWSIGYRECWFMFIETSPKTFYFFNNHWSRVDCDSVLRSAVCKKESAPTTPTITTTPPSPIQCPAHSTYKRCVAPCQSTCKNPYGPFGCDTNGTCVEGLSTDCNNSCVAGCQCDEGYSIDSSKSTFECIKTEECLCYNDLDDIYFPATCDRYLTNNCEYAYTCWNASSTLLPHQCEPDEECITMGTNKSQQCQSSKCPDGWRYLNSTGSCYKAIYNVTFVQAEEKCQSLGAHLTSIHSAEENLFIGKFSDNTYIGLKGYDYKWTDGSTYNYTKAINALFPWANGLKSDCWFMIVESSPKTFYFNDFNWSRVNCDSVLRRAVCKKKSSSPAQANYSGVLKL